MAVNAKIASTMAAYAADPRGVCAMAVEYDNGTCAAYTGMNCHADMNNRAVFHGGVIVDKGPKGIAKDVKYYVTSLWSKMNDEASNAFWEYIWDKDASPWRSALKDSEIVYNKDNRPVAGLIQADAKVQTAVNLMVASRIPYEYNHVSTSWYALVKEGVDKCEALYIANQADVNEDSLMYLGQKFGHYPFDNSVSFKKLQEGSPTTTRGDLRSKDPYHPNNSIWWNKNQKFYSLKQYMAEKKEFGGFFVNHFVKTHKVKHWPEGTCSLKPGLKAILDNKKEWYGD